MLHWLLFHYSSLNDHIFLDRLVMVPVWGWGTLGLRQLFRDRLLLGNMAFCVICNVNPTLLLSARHQQGEPLPLALPPSPLSQLPLFTRHPPGMGGASLGAFCDSWQHCVFSQPCMFFLLLPSMWFCSVSAAFVNLYMNFKVHWLHFFSRISRRMEFLCCFGKASCCFYDF